MRTAALHCALLGLTALRCIPHENPSAPAPHPSAGATMVVSADLWGYLAPCGCSENMRGGIARAAHQLLEAHRESPFVVYADAGDGLFGQPRIPQAEAPQAERKARALAHALALMGLSTRAVGELDNALGETFRRSLGLPEEPNPSARLFSQKGHVLAVAVGGNGKELTEAATSARAQGAQFVLGLLHQTLADAQRVAETVKPPVDVLVAGHAEGEFGAEENRLLQGQIPVVQLQSKGRSLLFVQLTFGPSPGTFEWVHAQQEKEQELHTLDERMEQLTRQLDAPNLQAAAKPLYRKKIAELAFRRQKLAASAFKPPSDRNAFALRFVPLDASLPEAPEVAAVVRQYEKDVAQQGLEWAQTHGQDCLPAKSGEASVVGTATCRLCHPDAFAVWQQTHHARAYTTLEQTGRAYDLECIGCHVTGAKLPGGVCRVDKVEGRTAVGCESCHGPGSLHAKNPNVQNIRAHPQEPACTGCHNPENSPHFDFAKYLPQILGPGHGARGSF